MESNVRLCVWTVCVGILILLPLNAQETTSGNRNCVFQDGSHVYHLKTTDSSCPSPVELQKNLTLLSDNVKSQVYDLERKISEVHYSTDTSVREVRQSIQTYATQIDQIKRKQEVLETAVNRINSFLERLPGYHRTCPNGYSRNGTSCYKFVEHASTWYQAEQYCFVQGSHLVSVETQEENNYLYSQLNSNIRFRPFSWWTGGNDIEVEGNYRWVGSGQTFNYSAWAPGEPSNRGQDHHGQAGSEQCMTLHTQTGWNDVICTVPTYFICELKLDIL